MHEKYWFEILGGILIVLSSLVGERMHNWKKWASYLLFGLLALAYIAMGIRIDQASDKRESEATAEARDNRTALLQSQSGLIEAQTELVNKSDEIAQLNKEIAAS